MAKKKLKKSVKKCAVGCLEARIKLKLRYVCAAALALFIGFFIALRPATYIMDETAFNCEYDPDAWVWVERLCDAGGKPITGRVLRQEAGERHIRFVENSYVKQSRTYIHGQLESRSRFDEQGRLILQVIYWPNGRVSSTMDVYDIKTITRHYSETGRLERRTTAAANSVGFVARNTYFNTNMGTVSRDSGSAGMADVFLVDEQKISGELRAYVRDGATLIMRVPLENGLIHGDMVGPTGIRDTFEYGLLRRSHQVFSGPDDPGVERLRSWLRMHEEVGEFDEMVSYHSPDRRFVRVVYLLGGRPVYVSCKRPGIAGLAIQTLREVQALRGEAVEPLPSWNATQLAELGYIPRCPFEI